MKIGPFLGINNLLAAHALHVTDKGDYLRNAVDVDIDATGRLSARRGVTKQLALTAGSSLYCDGTNTYLVSGGQLCRLDGGSLTQLAPVAGPVVYAQAGLDLYYSDATTLGIVGSTLPALPVPTGVLAHEDTAEARRARFLARMPAGNVLAYHDGRLLSANGNVLYYSEPYMCYAADLLKNFIQFPAPVSIVAPNSMGMYVVADQTYWVTGLGTDDMQMNSTLPYGAVRGTAGVMPDASRVFWMSERGIVIGDQQGSASPINEDRCAVELATTGASLLHTQPDRIITTLHSPRLSGREHQDYIDAEALRG